MRRTLTIYNLLIRMISISKAITRLRFSKLNHQHVDIFYYEQT